MPRKYGEGVTENDRLQVSVVAYDDGGGSEVFWARSNDIITTSHEGSLVLHPDGSATFKFWSDGESETNGSHENPYVLHIMGNRVVVAMTEDIERPPSPETVVFDSAQHALAVDSET